MAKLLLTGAGFSRNWGGWLADEVYEYLLGCPELNQNIRELLWKTRRKGGFEATLAKLGGHDDRTTLERAISEMFDNMNDSLSRNLRFHTGVRSFLAGFDAIFTLNQDLLLEFHYLDADGPGSWDGYAIPGVRPKAGFGGLRYVECEPLEHPGSFKIEPRTQPYFKLHGSSNWFRPGVGGRENKSLLIMGGNKATSIAGDPLLAWYLAKFREYVTGPNVRLLVIGYGFFDDHINNILMEGAGRNLRLFIIDPKGIDILDKRSQEQQEGRLPSAEPALLSQLRRVTLGASRRSLLREILGDDGTALGPLIRFLEG